MNELMKSLIELQTIELGQSADPNASAIVDELRMKIPAHILAHYDGMMNRGKKAIAPVRNQNCSGCHMRVPLATIMTLRHARDVQLCDNCGRYLYLPEGEDMNAGARARKAKSKPNKPAAKRASSKGS